MTYKRIKKPSALKTGLFLWDGRHFQIKTVEKPKEEFTVDDYTVYDFSSSKKEVDLARLYAFIVAKDGRQTATISVDGHPIMGPMYFLEGVEYDDSKSAESEKAIRRHATYRMNLKNRPTAGPKPI
jgi:hypothetical protein